MTQARDNEVLALQIGRPLRAESRVLRRCHLQLPIVAEVPPLLDGGEPFPTRYWLTCPLAHRRIARVEARGGVREVQARLDADPAFASKLREVHARYAGERDAALTLLEEAPERKDGLWTSLDALVGEEPPHLPAWRARSRWLRITSG